MATIGDGSCRDFQGCQGAGNNGEATIGDGSCDGAGAYLEAGINGVSSIGRGSCNGFEACLEPQDGGSIGRYSCNGQANCQNSSQIGDCLLNDVDPLPCVNIDFGVTKTASDTSLLWAVPTSASTSRSRT